MRTFQHIKAKDNNIFSVEVAVQVPERIVASTTFNNVSQVEVSLDAERGRHYPAKTKEFSLQSDPVARTYQRVDCGACTLLYVLWDKGEGKVSTTSCETGLVHKY